MLLARLRTLGKCGGCSPGLAQPPAACNAAPRSGTHALALVAMRWPAPPHAAHISIVAHMTGNLRWLSAVSGSPDLSARPSMQGTYSAFPVCSTTCLQMLARAGYRYLVAGCELATRQDYTVSDPSAAQLMPADIAPPAAHLAQTDWGAPPSRCTNCHLKLSNAERCLLDD